MRATYGDNIELVPISNREEFMDAWTKYATVNADVTMIAHGSPYRIYFGGGSEENIRVEDIVTLAANKDTIGKINTLKLYACNCGHKDVADNIATVIANKHNVARLYAMDGNISYHTPILGWFGLGGYKPRLSTAQSGFYKYAKVVKTYLNGLIEKLRTPTGLYRVK